MKNFISVAFLSLGICFHAKSQNSNHFVIHGQLTGDVPAYIYMELYDGKAPKTDSAKIVNGQYSFKGEISSPAPALIYFNTTESKDEPLKFYVDKSDNIVLKGNASSLNSSTIKGSKAQTEFEMLASQTAPIDHQMSFIYSHPKMVANQPDSSIYYNKMLDSLSTQKKQIIYDFAMQHHDSYISLYNLTGLFNARNINDIALAYNKLSTAIKQSAIGQSIGKEIVQRQAVGIGKLAPDFVSKDTAGEKVELKDFKGKYVLVDFWASWCAPCRAENPNVLKAYNKYKDKNFEVIGVSLDGGMLGKDKWINAIAQDHLPWIQISDLQGFDSPIASEYAIDAIPQNFLIDPNGVIIEKNLRGQNLQTTLAKYLN